MCALCHLGFEDFKSFAMHSVCGIYFYGMCQGVDMRGSHSRKITWRCKSSAGSHKAMKKRVLSLSPKM